MVCRGGALETIKETVVGEGRRVVRWGVVVNIMPLHHGELGTEAWMGDRGSLSAL